MKRFFYFVFAAFVAVSFVACGDDPGKQEQPKSIPVEMQQFLYFGDFYGNGGTNIVMLCTSDNVGLNYATNELSGTGYLLSIDINAAECVGNYPNEGSYPFVEVEKPAPGYAKYGYVYDWGVVQGYEPGEYLYCVGSYVIGVENGAMVDTLCIVDGCVNFYGDKSDAKIEFDFVYDDGTEANFVYEGSVNPVRG